MLNPEGAGEQDLHPTAIYLLEHGREWYGVVVDPASGAADMEGTGRLREERTRARGTGERRADPVTAPPAIGPAARREDRAR